MANYVESFASKLDWAMPFQRTGKFPLDRTDLFSTYADAVKYAAGNTADPDTRALCGTSYVGQIITVFEDDVVTVYKINADRSLAEVGKATVGDDKSIVLVDGVLKLKGFQEVIAAGNFNGMQPRINADGALEWFKPDTSTVAGLQEAVGALQNTVNGTETTDGLVKKVSDLQTATTNLENGKVDKVEGKGLSTNDFTDALNTKLTGIEAGAQVNVQSDWNATEGDALILNKPTKLSQFTNDQNFIDNTVDNLQNYYKKTETYTKTEVTTLIGNLKTIELQVVTELPETGQSNVIYLKKNAGTGNNSYDEYLWITDADGSRFELIGTTEVDLSTYLTKTGDASKTTVTPATQATAPADGSSLDKYIGYVKGKVDGLATVASTGKYTDLTDRPVETKVVTGSIAAGSLTATLNPGNAAATLVSYFAIDATTNEQIMCDVKTVAASKAVIFTIAAAYANAINLTATYTVPAV